MVGIAGSGKSTMAAVISGDRNVIHISMDDIRRDRSLMRETALRYDGDDADLTGDARRAEAVLILEAMRTGRDVVIDDTNLTRKIRQAHIRRAAEHGYEVNCIFMDTPLDDAVRRNGKMSDDAVSEEAVIHHSSVLERPEIEEGFGSLRVV